MTGRASRRLRALGLAATLATVIGLSLGGAGWAQVARAQTVPTLTFTPPPATARPTAMLPTATTGAPPGSATTPPPASATPFVSPVPATQATATPATATPLATVRAELAACGPAPYAGETAAGDPTALVSLGAGSVQLLSTDGLASGGGPHLTVAKVAAAVVAVAQLPPPPRDWRQLSCGLQASAAGASEQAANFLPGGLVVCLSPPPDTGPDAKPRLAYYDAPPGLGRWVFIPSQATSGQLCSARFHLPALFALLTPAL